MKILLLLFQSIDVTHIVMQPLAVNKAAQISKICSSPDRRNCDLGQFQDDNSYHCYKKIKHFWALETPRFVILLLSCTCLRVSSTLSYTYTSSRQACVLGESYPYNVPVDSPPSRYTGRHFVHVRWSSSFCKQIMFRCPRYAIVYITIFVIKAMP